MRAGLSILLCLFIWAAPASAGPRWPSLRQVKEAVRRFTAAAAPRATADQRRDWGLFLPDDLTTDHPLVVLVHGLNYSPSEWASLGTLLRRNEYQVAHFRYPDDQPIARSAALFAEHMRAMHEVFPGLTVDVVTHSMGALVARQYIEGPAYAGGIQRLIMIAPPNHGSAWASLAPLLELHEQYEAWRNNPDWHWTWLITDGLDEAGVDLKPDSDFLQELNSRPRRAGVTYTIIAGSHTPWQRWEALGLNTAAGWIPKSIDRIPGVDLCRGWIRGWSERIASRDSGSDGVVSVKSARLSGVEDVVILPADHEDLYRADAGGTPAAWKALLHRLAR